MVRNLKNQGMMRELFLISKSKSDDCHHFLLVRFKYRAIESRSTD
jgi:hypothetical protein